MNQNSNYYKIIGVNPSVSDEELQSAFKALFARYNPSSNPNSMYLKTMFQQLNEAYEILGDKVKREEYNISKGFDVPKGTIETVSSSSVVEPKLSDGAMPPPLPQTYQDRYTQRLEREPLPPVERVEVKQESIVRERDCDYEKNDNKAYVFLFVLIGVILIGGGVFAYFEFSDTEKNSGVEERIEEKPDNIAVKDGKEKVEEIKSDNHLEEVKGEIKVEEPTVKVADAKVEEELNPKVEPMKESAPVMEKKQNGVPKEVEKKQKTEQKKSIDPIVKKTNNVKEESTPKRAFKLGASKTDVWAAKGDPTDITTSGDFEIWHYGKTKIKFKNGKVVE